MKIRRSMLERVFREELKNILAEKALLSEIAELAGDNDLDSSEDVVAEHQTHREDISSRCDCQDDGARQHQAT